jgi:hypothetical protein
MEEQGMRWKSKKWDGEARIWKEEQGQGRMGKELDGGARNGIEE